MLIYNAHTKFSSGEPWVATHIGMPFGAAASGIAWHKIGHLLTLIGRKLLGLPLLRYVDDYFSTDRYNLCSSAQQNRIMDHSMAGLKQ